MVRQVGGHGTPWHSGDFGANPAAAFGAKAVGPYNSAWGSTSTSM